MFKALQFLSPLILAASIAFAPGLSPEAKAESELGGARRTTKKRHNCGQYGQDRKTKRCRTKKQYCSRWINKNKRVCKKNKPKNKKKKRNKKKKTTRAKTSAKALHSPRRAKEFIKACKRKGIKAKFCNEIVAPNKHSKGTFNRIYGKKTPHLLIPGKNKWKKGIDLLKIAQKTRGICQIANWYRPEPYNRAVKGARTSTHLNANAIDIHYCSRAARNKALKKFKKIEKTKRSLGIGTYSTKGSITIHIDFNTRNYHE